MIRLLDTENLNETPENIQFAKDMDEKFQAEQKAHAEQKIHNVHRFIKANPDWNAHAIADKFGLDWSLDKDYGNGASKITFYTDESMLHSVMTLRLPTTDFFRG